MDVIADASILKRKRDETSAPATEASPGPAAKSTKTTGTSQLSINYLARQSPEDLPLVNKDDTLPNLLHLLASYGGVLDRHESLASNLGARPLGPILIKRFERCFDSPPKVVASHHKGQAISPDETTQSITWLEVIEFARAHPIQFSLSSFSEGKRVCQFYYPQKQLRVQISEEDFLFINSGRCQELIPPLPIWEDEEKEVATCDVLEVKLKELTNAADMVAARTRQLSHRLKGRRAAILERRAEGGIGTPAKANAIQTTTAPPSTAGASFTAVNTGGMRPGDRPESALGSSTVRSDLLRHFESLPQNQEQSRTHARQPSFSMPDASGRPGDWENGRAMSTASSLSPVPPSAFPNDNTPHNTTETSSGQRQSSTAGQPSTPGNAPLKHNFSRPLPAALESSQPFRPLCQAHMDSLSRGQRVLPPCDRCRRLRMDCVKNLTSCAGCTKKHARCHWRDVSREELNTLDHMLETHFSLPLAHGQTNGMYHDDSDDDDDSNPLEDLEALGEKEEREVAERLREDRDGLDGAKELARHGREDKSPHDDRRSHSPPQATIEMREPLPTVVAQDNTPAAPVRLPEAKDEVVEHHLTVPPPQPPPPPPPSVANDTAPREPPRESVPFEMTSTHSGFRAVNDATAAAPDAAAIAPRPSAWQAV